MTETGQTDPRIAARVRQYQLGEREQFFDLAHDPDERHNLIRDP
jgi:hypothetical protein